MANLPGQVLVFFLCLLNIPFGDLFFPFIPSTLLRKQLALRQKHAFGR